MTNLIMNEGTVDVTWEDKDFKDLSYESITYGNQISILDEKDFSRYNIGMDYTKGSHIGNLLGVDGKFPWLTDVNYAIHKIHPGKVLPYHADYYIRYKDIYKVKDSNKIQRIILFLEDWKRGQLLGIENRIISNWSAGDWVSWYGETNHMAANLGHHDRYTLQITGHIK